MRLLFVLADIRRAGKLVPVKVKRIKSLLASAFPLITIKTTMPTPECQAGTQGV